MEYRRANTAAHCAGTVLQNMVVSDAADVCGHSPDLGRSKLSHSPAQTSQSGTARFFSAVNCLSGERTKAYRGGTARQPRTAISRYQQPRTLLSSRQGHVCEER